MKDTLVPGASHPTVTSDACPGRIPVADNRVESCHIAVSADDMADATATCTTSCRTLTDELRRAASYPVNSSIQSASHNQIEPRYKAATAASPAACVGPHLPAKAFGCVSFELDTSMRPRVTTCSSLE